MDCPTYHLDHVPDHVLPTSQGETVCFLDTEFLIYHRDIIPRSRFSVHRQIVTVCNSRVPSGETP